MAFLMQFCFAESRDHVRELPGDVLLVFVRTVGPAPFLRATGLPVFSEDTACIVSDDPQCLAFEWYSIGLGSLMSPDDIPLPRITLPMCYGVRHRSLDYLRAEENCVLFDEVVKKGSLPDHPFENDATLRALSHHPGIKIGGQPHYWLNPQRTPPDRQFIASFSGVLPCWDFPYPWVNHRTPFSPRECLSHSNRFVIADGCTMTFYLQGNGDVNWHAEFL